MSDDKLSLELHGPAVTADAAREAGEALVDLLNALAESEGITPGSIEWDVSVAFQCDGCGLPPSLNVQPSSGSGRSGRRRLLPNLLCRCCFGCGG